MDVIVTGNRGKERTYMKTFTIDEQNNITAFGTQEEAAATTTTPFDSFASEQELTELAKAWPPERFVAIWNSIPGVKPVKNVKNAEGAAGRIWERIQTLGETAEPKAKGGAHAAKGASSKAKATKTATAAKSAPRAKEAAKAQGDAGPREGSKTAQVVAMLPNKNLIPFPRPKEPWANRTYILIGSDTFLLDLSARLTRVETPPPRQAAPVVGIHKPAD